MAEVWLARDERLQRDVAVKFLAANLTDEPEFLVRFFSEAQAAARISHPNVVSILDFGDCEGLPYLVMEHVPAGTLCDLTGKPLLPERALEIVAGAASGAGAAHRLGLVHRDIKPGNILLDTSGAPKLADFGIASSQVSERLTATGTAIGSPHYISPEQATGGAVTPASDVYSLGAVLYELLTGRPPFEGDNVTAIAIAHVEQEPRPPSALTPGLPAELDEVVLACLAKDPSARPADGDTLATLLQYPAAHTITFEAPVVVSAPKRRLIPALVVASLLLALAGALYVGARPDDVAEAGISGRDRPVVDPSGPRRRATPTPSSTTADSSAVSTTPTPPATPAPTPTPESEEEARATPTPREEQDDEPLWTPDPATPKPTPAPSEEPEPTPPPSEPTAEPEPTDGG